MPYSVNGSKNDLYPEQIRFEEDKICRRRTTLEKCLIAVAVILFILAVILAILFAVYYIKADEDNNGVCITRNCVVAASSIVVKMDTQVDPCQNFAEFACGGFYKDTVIPDEKNRVDSFSLVTDQNEQLLRIILEEPTQNDEPGFVMKMKTYYRNCMDEAKIEEIGVKPFTESAMAKKWPTINPAWDPSTFDLNDLITEYEGVFVESLFMYFVSLNLEDTKKHMLHLTQPGLGLPLKFLKLPRNDTTIMAYQQYYEDMSVILGADAATAQSDAEKAIDFEMELAKILVTAEESIDLSTLNNPSTLRNMSVDYPYIQFHRAIQAAFDTIDMEIPEDLPIINRHPKFFNKLEALLNATEKRVIQNRFGFQYARLNVETLTMEMRQAYMKYAKIRLGKREEDPRWKQCIDRTRNLFGDGIGKKFVNETFSESSKTYMDTMISNLKTAFSGLLKESDWMGAETKKAAFLKLEKMRRKIGYPDKDFSDQDIEHNYENYTVWDGEFYKTYRYAFTESNKDGLRNLHKPVDKDKWRMNPAEVNAYFSGSSNEIGFPAGILQPPFFSNKFPSSVNYGAIGAVIGHEITHGFDQSGSQYDYEGNLKNWWQPKDLTEFKNRTQCVIDQYSAFKVEEIGLNVNGELTAGENTADIGGLKEAYRAYKTYADTQPEELPLPGLGLTTDKQFFLAFSQLWCSKRTDASLKMAILGGVHSPGRFRINGPLRNNEAFARTFNCPLGSPMNPAKKCVVW